MAPAHLPYLVPTRLHSWRPKKAERVDNGCCEGKDATTESLRPIIVLTTGDNGLGADELKGKCPRSEAKTSVPKSDTNDSFWTPTTDLLFGLEGELSRTADDGRGFRQKEVRRVPTRESIINTPNASIHGSDLMRISSQSSYAIPVDTCTSILEMKGDKGLIVERLGEKGAAS